MKIIITNNNATIRLIESCEDPRLELHQKQNLTMVDREMVNDILSNSITLRDHILNKNVVLDSCPHLNYLWFNSIVIYNPFSAFITELSNIIKKVHIEHQIKLVFFLDLWPVIIAVFPDNNIEVFYNKDKVNIAKALEILTIGMEFNEHSLNGGA